MKINKSGPIFRIFKNFLRYKVFTNEQDNILRSYKTRKELKKDYQRNKLQHLFPTKEYKHVSLRWENLNPRYYKGSWTKEEDNIIIKYIEMFGTNWSILSKLLKRRTNKQIRLRFLYKLDQRLRNGSKKFTPEQDQIIMENYPTLKNCWIKYTKLLPDKGFKAIRYRCRKLLKEAELNEQTASSSNFIENSPDI